MRTLFFALLVLVPASLIGGAQLWPPLWWSFVIVGPLCALGLYDALQKQHSLLRVYPIIGRGRFLRESIPPEIQQNFVESNIDGAPYSREMRSVIYQRAKGAMDTMPFGTQRELHRTGSEWLEHSLAPQSHHDMSSRVSVGGPDCKKPYLASRFNISAMSYGSLSKNAVRALNRGARLDDFAHNTGEGGLSPYHLSEGGDIIWQIGTGYFGCRGPRGQFDAELFAERSNKDCVKMIEIKLSQGAKPGHGGILPAAKVTPEIAEIRGVPLGQDVLSPPAHTAFGTPEGLLRWLATLRELSGGKPVGFKLCIGRRDEFLGICKAMIETGITPDFITVDGAEGGTGAAPLELSNAVGTPLRHGLLFVNSALRGIGLRDHIRIIASGKIVTGFHLVRALALGADMCNAARAMMFALGCIQARSCNDNTCPVGVATQDPARMAGLDVDDKAQRVGRFHHATINSFLELVASMGLDSPDQVGPLHLVRQVDTVTTRHFDQIYEYLKPGCLLDATTVPQDWKKDWDLAHSDRF